MYVWFSIFKLQLNQVEKLGFSPQKMLGIGVPNKELKEKMKRSTVAFKHLKPQSSFETWSHLRTNIGLSGTGIGAYTDPGKRIKISL